MLHGSERQTGNGATGFRDIRSAAVNVRFALGRSGIQTRDGMETTADTTERRAKLQPDPRRIIPLAMVERWHIERVLTHPEVNGRRDIAAELLGIGRTTLYRKLKEYGAVRKRAL